MADIITRYKSRDGKEHTRKEDAEEHDRFLSAKAIVYPVAGPQYSPGYDGPMSPWEPSAETFFYHRKLLRNIFLDLPEPDPKIVIKTMQEKVYHYPFTLMGICLALGLWAGHVWL